MLFLLPGTLFFPPLCPAHPHHPHGRMPSLHFLVALLQGIQCLSSTGLRPHEDKARTTSALSAVIALVPSTGAGILSVLYK